MQSGEWSHTEEAVSIGASDFTNTDSDSLIVTFADASRMIGSEELAPSNSIATPNHMCHRDFLDIGACIAYADPGQNPILALFPT